MLPTVIPPITGNQFTIMYGNYKAVITQMGATLRTFTYQGTDLVVPLSPDEPVNCCHGQILIPFPNRIEDGTYTFEGRTYTLPIDEHDRNNAIHGYGYRSLWDLQAITEHQVTLMWRVPNMSGYPFYVSVQATYRLDDDGLHIRVTASNDGTTNAPWALAIHPWLDNGLQGYGDEIDGHNAQCKLTIPAHTHVTVNDRLLPTGTEPVDGTKYDLRQGVYLTEQPFDDAFTDVEHDENGTVTAQFVRPDGLCIEIGGDKTITSFQVCTGTGFPAYQHPAGVAVEPQTAYANAFNTGNDLVILEPSSTYSTELFIRVAQ